VKKNEFIEIEPDINLHIRDWGKGKTIVFIPGWPLSHEMYEYQFTQLPLHNFRCIGITRNYFSILSAKREGVVYNFQPFA